LGLRRAYTDFFRAVNIDDVGAVRSLLAQGFDPNAVDSKGNSALYLALRYNSLKVAKVLIDDPHIHLNYLNPSDENALMIACLQGDLGIVKLMVEKGAEINKPGWTPLSYAATRGAPKSSSICSNIPPTLTPPRPTAPRR
jgi:Ankyrin repeat.